MASKEKPVTKPDEIKESVYRFFCPSDIWNKLKEATPKSMTMNDKLLDLVYRDLGIENPNTGNVNLSNPPKKK